MRRIKVPRYAKRAALTGLEERKSFPKSRRPGLEPSQAKKLGINSGVARARQIIRSDTISQADAKRIGAFYDRFKNRKTPRSEIAIKLWGGRTWGSQLARKF